MAKISIRDASGNEINLLDFGQISAGGTSNSFIFRVYNNYEQEENVRTAYNVRVGLVLYKYSRAVNVYKKGLERYVIKNGVFEIDCTVSSKLNGGYPSVDWTPIRMVNGSVGYFEGEEFDEISPEAPNNFNEYKIRIKDFPYIDWFRKGVYKVYIIVRWSDK